ncbi:YybH family protein [Pseudoalteromonas denitrificans]|uniref:Ketosteroid isomerase homolog n=1 Tax=Pseudoalteromonas denitrificans DSM 6059 TaxID=1123010 RepID=A0A1I1QPE9_9GAMM|nr:nuclear transport factor 2 family protein [Pseudoalteromonas denitrificans]SFD21153.1 Ketosteroid isomerase homolog [Pseudoalteromonas denitrificans DSM 6059]
MKKYILLAIILIMSQVSYAKTDKNDILSIMSMQQNAWNNGDIKQYMQGYWQSEQLKFIGKNGIKYGWQETLKNYIKSYPDKSSMGQLTFDILEVNVMQDTAFVLGKWSLKRKSDNPNGYYTLFWKKINNQWRIVIDHSS